MTESAAAMGSGPCSPPSPLPAPRLGRKSESFETGFFLFLFRFLYLYLQENGRFRRDAMVGRKTQISWIGISHLVGQ